MSLSLYELRDGRFLVQNGRWPHIVRPTGKHTYSCDCELAARCPCVGAVQEHVQARTLASLAKAATEQETA